MDGYQQGESTASAAMPGLPVSHVRIADHGSDAPLAQLDRLTSLLDISRVLSGTLKARAAMRGVLDILTQRHGVVRGIVMLRDDTGGLAIEASDRFDVTTASREGIGDRSLADTVMSTGRPAVVPRTRVGSPVVVDGDERTLVCAPLVLERQPIGVLSIALQYDVDRDMDRALSFFSTVATMLAQAVKVERLAEDDRRRLEVENSQLRQELRDRYDFSNIVGSSGPVRQMYEQLAHVAGTNTTVLIRGESGTGKELIAHAVHYNSLRARRPFVKVSCAALPETLIEAELFGYEKGAFTGAAARKKGRFELAHGGTLFLDEVGDIPLATQVTLLRVLQEREFERVGGTDTVRTNVRIIAATNSDLEKAISDGTFREDLYYRLNVFTLFVPPLRERKADILLLVNHFLERLARDHHKEIRRVSAQAVDVLMTHHWPGNVRELENVVERAVLVCDGPVIHAHHLPATLQTPESSGTVSRVSLSDAVEAVERDLIQDALRMTRGNRSRAAQLLESTERIVNYKIRQLGIDYRRFRAK